MSPLVRNFLLGIILIIFIVYLAFQLKGFVFGADVIIFSPRDGEHSTSSHVIVRGRALGISFLTLDGRTIFTDDKGFFEEELILPYGLNIISVIGKGKFGREFREERTVYVTGKLKIKYQR